MVSVVTVFHEKRELKEINKIFVVVFIPPKLVVNETICSNVCMHN